MEHSLSEPYIQVCIPDFSSCEFSFCLYQSSRNLTFCWPSKEPMALLVFLLCIIYFCYNPCYFSFLLTWVQSVLSQGGTRAYWSEIALSAPAHCLLWASAAALEVFQGPLWFLHWTDYFHIFVIFQVPFCEYFCFLPILGSLAPWSVVRFLEHSQCPLSKPCSHDHLP